MTFTEVKAIERPHTQIRTKQSRRRRPKVLKLNSSEAPSDQHEKTSHISKLVSPSPTKVHMPQARPLPASTMRELDESVRKTLSQDWLKERFSPRPRGAKRSGAGGEGCTQAVFLSSTSLATIAEDRRYEDCEYSADLTPTTVSAINYRTMASARARGSPKPRKGTYKHV